jgi:hypothetical protein
MRKIGDEIWFLFLYNNVQVQLGKTNSKHFQILSKLALTQQSCREDQVDGSVCGTSNSKRVHKD